MLDELAVNTFTIKNVMQQWYSCHLYRQHDKPIVNSNARTPTQYQAAIKNIMTLLNQRRVDDAANACLQLLQSHPQSNDALLLLGKARQIQGRFADMLQLVETALTREPDNVSLQLQFAGAAQFCGHHDRALEQLAKAERAAQSNADLLLNVAQLFVGSQDYRGAHRCYLRAVELNANNPHYLSNLAASYIAIGELESAEATYSKVIRRRPKNYEAWYNRSTLRKQTPDDNHTAQLEKALRQLAADDPGETALCYALAKEYEDLGRYDKSFEMLERGAARKRSQLNYSVQLDVELMQQMTEICNASFATRVAPATPRRGPVFVLGLPRSGTTLVDRILNSHSKVVSMGEIGDFALTLNRVAGTTERQQLLATYSRLDLQQLGDEYLRSVRSYGTDSELFIDKNLFNFLNIGLIAKALPGAPIIHVRRNSVDSCLSLFRALFRTGNPYSYDLNDLADYYIAYSRLMQHWHDVFPGAIKHIVYEELVDDQENISRKLIADCGLDWETACLDFAANSAPVATASAAQVRKPIYRDAMARWRHFEKHLRPLIDKLQDAGIAV